MKIALFLTSLAVISSFSLNLLAESVAVTDDPCVSGLRKDAKIFAGPKVDASTIDYVARGSSFSQYTWKTIIARFMSAIATKTDSQMSIEAPSADIIGKRWLTHTEGPNAYSIMNAAKSHEFRLSDTNPNLRILNSRVNRNADSSEVTVKVEVQTRPLLETLTKWDITNIIDPTFQTLTVVLKMNQSGSYTPYAMTIGNSNFSRQSANKRENSASVYMPKQIIKTPVDAMSLQNDRYEGVF